MNPGAEGRGGERPLPAGVRDIWAAAGWPVEGARIAVACSGGVDSLSLLHLLRFPLADLGLDLSVAHFDHGMRESGREEAEWLAGVAGAWGLPMYHAQAEHVPRNETQARTARYRFLGELVESGRVDRILTAHHADDQVETVLFRILRGTGIEGLQGIPEHRHPGILRPLLSCSRKEIEAYADKHGLRPRIDPSNRSPRFARNRIRHELIPLAEAIHPGARAATLRLARNAHEAADVLNVLLQERLERVEIAQDDPEGAVLDRTRLLAEEACVQGALIRRVARRVGGKLSRTGTATALQFLRGGSSGSALRLPGGILIEREFDTFRVRRTPEDSRPDSGDIPLLIRRAGDGPVPAGSGRLRAGGRWFEARWTPGTDAASTWWDETSAWSEGGSTWSATFDPAQLAFPLTLRGWRPGDRMHTEGGGRKLKKFFGEQRIPVRERHRLPLLVEAAGEVLWIPGLHRSARFQAGAEASSLTIGVRVTDGK